MSEAESGDPRRSEPGWHKKIAFLAGFGLLVVLFAMLFHERNQGAVQGVPSDQHAAGISETASQALPSEIIDAAGEGSHVDPAPDGPAPMNGPSGADERITERGCKRAPIRGCAPRKDERGCYHCTRCWRPFHYDLQARVTALSFACAEMPEAHLYVELSSTSSAPPVPQIWAISVSFDGRRVEQAVTPNLGGAFFAGFRGGNVELTARLDSCGPSAVPCRGDIDVTINARADGAR